VATVVGSLAVISPWIHEGRGPTGRYYALVLFFIGGMVGLVLSGSLLLMFFFWKLRRCVPSR
jgi:NADH:ubiquinone oxidoreductase subunit 5 (subunit L)/multisubunit Na+/H+ antiporter MnhA subunit